MAYTKQRLAKYRRKAAESKYPPAQDWRCWRSNPWASSPNSYGDKGQMHVNSLDDIGQNVGDAHAITPRRIDHTGWYADHFQDAVIRGAVVKMRCSKGTMYIPATYCTDWDGATLYMNDYEIVPKGANDCDHEAAKQQAALSADHYAEREAEQSREDDAKDQAEQDILQAREEIHDNNKKALALIKELKTAPTLPEGICSAVRGALLKLLDTRQQLFRTISDREYDYWTAVN